MVDFVNRSVVDCAEAEWRAGQARAGQPWHYLMGRPNGDWCSDGQTFWQITADGLLVLSVKMAKEMGHLDPAFSIGSTGAATSRGLYFSFRLPREALLALTK